MDGTELDRINNYNVLDNVYGQYLGDMDQDNLLAGGSARQNQFPSFPTRTWTAAAGVTVSDSVSGLTVACTVTGAAATTQMAISSIGSDSPYKHE